MLKSNNSENLQFNNRMAELMQVVKDIMDKLQGVYNQDQIFKIVIAQLKEIPDQRANICLLDEHGKVIGVIDTTAPALSGKFIPGLEAIAKQISINLERGEELAKARRNELALRTSEDQLWTILDNAPGAVLLIQAGKILYSNAVAEKVLGWIPEDFLGKDFAFFVHKDDVLKAAGNYQERMSGNYQLAPYTIRLCKKAGDTLYIEINGTVITLDGKQTMLAFLTNVTEKIEETRDKHKLIELSEYLLGATADTLDYQYLTDTVLEISGAKYVDFNCFSETGSGVSIQAVSGINDNLDVGEVIVAKIMNDTVNIGAFSIVMPKDKPFTKQAIVELYCHLLGLGISGLQSNQQIKNLLAEKELILREVHHRIKNHMNAMIALLVLQSSMSKSTETQVALEEAQNRLLSMSVLYERLYQSEDFQIVSSRLYFPALVNEIIHNFPGGENVTIEFSNLEDILFSTKIISSLGIIINELLTNSMKYAFQGIEAREPVITIDLHEQPNGLIGFSIADNGVGLPEEFDINNSKGFGMTLVQSLISQLGGAIVESPKPVVGTIFKFEFKI